MIAQRGLQAETLAAHLAPERPLARVSADVPLEIGRFLERLFAVLAGVFATAGCD